MNEIEQEYIKNGCYIVNAVVTAADISTEDGPTVNVTLKMPCGGVVFGGICYGTCNEDNTYTGWNKGMTAILRIMQIAEVEHWNDMVGKPVRAVLKAGKIVAIGHFLYDKFMDYNKPPFRENE